MKTQLRVQVFARLRERIGKDNVTVALSEPATVDSLRLAIGEAFGPEFASLVRVSAVAVNGEYASDEMVVKSTDEIALIPPVSGG